MATPRNPKQAGSNVFDANPQTGKCKVNCGECFFNRPEAFFVPIDRPHMPTVEEVGDGIVRVNSGNDSNFQREFVIEATKIYKHRFFNTAIPRHLCDFPAPIVLTANPREENEASYATPKKIMDRGPWPENLMYVRLRTSSTNLDMVERNAKLWVEQEIPVVLTFMAYYTGKPAFPENYEWRTRIKNSYWCVTPKFMADTLVRMKKAVGQGRLITMCGLPNSYFCKDCRNCETYYWQTAKHLKEVGNW